MSMHDMQFDSVNSSPQAKKHFLLSTLPVFSSLAILNTLVYTPAAPAEIKVAAVGLMAGLYGYNLFLDKKIVSEK